MVGWGEGDLYIECGHYVLVEVGCESIPIIRDRQAGAAIPARPLKEGLAAFCRGGLAEGVTFDPPTRPIKTTEQISTAFRLR